MSQPTPDFTGDLFPPLFHTHGTDTPNYHSLYVALGGKSLPLTIRSDRTRIRSTNQVFILNHKRQRKWTLPRALVSEPHLPTLRLSPHSRFTTMVSFSLRQQREIPSCMSSMRSRGNQINRPFDVSEKEFPQSRTRE